MFGAGYSGTVEDTELVDGFLFDQKTSGAGGPNKVEKAKIALIQFCISPPKTDVGTTTKYTHWPTVSISAASLLLQTY